MEKNFCLIVVATFVLGVFSACSKKPVAKITASPYLTVSSGSIGSFYASGTGVSADGAAGAKIEIVGTGIAGRRMMIYINPYNAKVGTLVDSGTYIGVEYSTSSLDTIIRSTIGTITLTAVKPNIMGKFVCIGTDGNTFIGSFNVAAP